MFSLQQLIFFLAFFSLFFLLLIFGETPSGIVLMGLLVVLCLIFYRRLNFSRGKQHICSIIALALIVICSGFSILFSVSVPFTVNKFIFYLFSFILFLFLFFADEELIEQKTLEFGIILVGLVLSAMTTTFLIFPNLARYLQTMNLLFSTYGHNHAGVYFLFALPISIKIFLDYQKKRWLVILPIIFLASLCMSFGRVAIFLGLLEILFVTFFFRRKVLISMTVPLLVMLLVIGFFTLSPSISSAEHCSIPIFKMQLCKPLAEENRPAYWSQAVQAIIKKPLTGWGGGSFPVISTMYAQELGQFSAYSHNEYLQFAAEYGLIAVGVFVIFIGIIIREAAFIFRKHDTKDGRFFWALSLSALIIDSLFDYNWEYIGIWCLFLIGVVVVLKKQKPQVINQFCKILIKTLWWGTSTLMILWVIVYLLSTALWVNGQLDTSQRIFPFIYWRVEEAVKDEKLSTGTTKEILMLYQNDRSLIQNYITAVNDSETKTYWQKHVVDLEPLDLSAHENLLQLFFQQQQWQEYLIELQRINQIFTGKRKDAVPDTLRASIIENGVIAANQAISINPSIASQIYLELYHFQPWLIADPQYPQFKMLLFPEQYPSPIIQNLLHQINPQMSLWRYQKPLIAWYWSQLNMVMKKQEWSKETEIAENLVRLSPFERTGIWQSVSLVAQSEFLVLINHGQTSAAENLLDQWSTTLFGIEGTADNEKVPYMYENELAEDYLMLGNVLDTHNQALAIADYQKAKQILPWVEPNMQELQRELNTEINESDWTHAEQHAQLLAELFKEDYWASAQLGNFYYLRGQADAAQQSYQKCVMQVDPQKTDCAWGLRSIRENWQDGGKRFWQASVAILQNK